MSKKAIIEQHDVDENGKIVRTFKNLNDDGDDAMIHKVIPVQSEDESLQAFIKLDDDGALKVVIAGKEHRILTTGINSQTGEVVFSGTKTMRVNFPTTFKKWPSISLTLVDENNTPPHRIWPGKTGFTVRFKSNFSGIVAWTAVEG